MSTSAGSNSASGAVHTRCPGRPAWRTAPTGVSGGRCARSSVQRGAELPVPVPAARVVEAGDQVGRGRRGHPPLDHRPRGVQVGQRDQHVVVPERGPEQRRGGQRGGHPGHPDHLDVRRRPAAARGWPWRRPRRPRSRSARPRAPSRPAPPRRRPAAPPSPRPLARTSVPGRSRCATCSTYWSRPTTTDARRSSASARGTRRSAAPGPEPDDGQPAPGPDPGRGHGHVVALELLRRPARPAAPPASSAAACRAAASATLGVPTSARTTSLGFGTGDPGQHRGRVGAQRGRRDRGQDAGLVGLEVDAGVGPHGPRVQTVLALQPVQGRGHRPAGTPAGAADADHQRRRAPAGSTPAPAAAPTRRAGR